MSERSQTSILKAAGRVPQEKAKPIAQGFFFQLSSDPDEPVVQQGPLMRGGRTAVLRHLQAMEQLGVSHVAFNMKPSRRPAEEVMDELAECILPQFTVKE